MLNQLKKLLMALYVIAIPQTTVVIALLFVYLTFMIYLDITSISFVH
jgi:hypothetical protein